VKTFEFSYQFSQKSQKASLLNIGGTEYMDGSVFLCHSPINYLHLYKCLF